MTPRLADTPVLETERLTLRAPGACDLDVFAPFMMSDRARFVGGGADKTLGDAWRALAIIAGHWHLRGFGLFVAESKETGMPVGAFGPWYPGGWPERELSWTIWTEAAEGKGYAYEGVRRLRAHVHADLGWDTAVSYIDAQNTRSVTLARRLGCTLDETAARPDRGERIQVWRHPAPEDQP